MTDPSQARAKRLVQELSVRVMKFMNTADRGTFETAVEDVNRRLSGHPRPAGPPGQAAPSGPSRRRPEPAAGTSPPRPGRSPRSFSSQRASLIMADVTRGRAVLVDDGAPTVLRVSSSLAPRAALALVLGLCLSIATAAAIETLRPKVPDARGLARVLGAPMLATVKQSPASLAGTLSLVARRNGLDTVVILPAVPTQHAQASALARSLSRSTAGRDRVLDPVLVDGGPGRPPPRSRTGRRPFSRWTFRR